MDIDAVMLKPALARPESSISNHLPEAFEDLFRAEYARVVGIANQALADAAEAEDVAQEVFLSFHQRHSAQAPYAAAWLHRAAWHAALNRLRGDRRRRRREGAAGPDALTLSPDPAAIVERSQEGAAVRAAMSRLPQRSAAVLALRYSGLSYAEVGAALGVGVGQVGTLLRRAEEKLRTEVAR